MSHQCDLCESFKAKYDGKVKGQYAWAYMCDRCFKLYGVGLGVGKGDELDNGDNGEIK